MTLYSDKERSSPGNPGRIESDGKKQKNPVENEALMISAWREFRGSQLVVFFGRAEFCRILFRQGTAGGGGAQHLIARGRASYPRGRSGGDRLYFEKVSAFPITPSWRWPTGRDTDINRVTLYRIFVQGPSKAHRGKFNTGRPAPYSGGPVWEKKRGECEKPAVLRFRQEVPQGGRTGFVFGNYFRHCPWAWMGPGELLAKFPPPGLSMGYLGRCYGRILSKAAGLWGATRTIGGANDVWTGPVDPQGWAFLGRRGGDRAEKLCG